MTTQRQESELSVPSTDARIREEEVQSVSLSLAASPQEKHLWVSGSSPVCVGWEAGVELMCISSVGCLL